MIGARGRLWIGRTLLAVLGPLFWVEFVLQVAALFVPHEVVETDPGTPCLALCVGDSYTFGLGASSAGGSYPAQLESALRAAPIDGRSRVSNGGYPGRNSRELLLELPRQVQRDRPRFVVILVGINDLWSRPERVDVEDAAGARELSRTRWRLRWRSLRLLQLLLRAPKTAEGFAGMGERADPKADGTRPVSPRPTAPRPRMADAQRVGEIAGAWQHDGDVAVFERNGHARYGGGEFRWRFERAGELALERAGGAGTIRVRARRSGDRLLLAPIDAAFAAEFVRAPDVGPDPRAPAVPTDWSGRLQELESAGDLSAAFAWTERWIAAEPDEPWARCGHCRLAMLTGREALVPGDVGELERSHRDLASRDASEALAIAYGVSNQIDRATALARSDADRFPDSGVLRYQLAVAADRAGDESTAIREVTRSLELEGAAPASSVAFKYRQRATWRYRLGNEAEAVADVIRALRACPSEDLERQTMETWKDDAHAVDAGFALVDASADERASIRRRFGEIAAGGDAAPPATLVDHLRQAVRWCRDQGSEPLICSYPFRNAAVVAAQRKVAAEEHARFIDLYVKFDALLRTRERSALFVPDGHCTDEGYRIVAQYVEAALRSMPR